MAGRALDLEVRERAIPPTVSVGPLAPIAESIHGEVISDGISLHLIQCMSLWSNDSSEKFIPCAHVKSLPAIAQWLVSEDLLKGLEELTLRFESGLSLKGILLHVRLHCHLFEHMQETPMDRVH